MRTLLGVVAVVTACSAAAVTGCVGTIGGDGDGDAGPQGSSGGALTCDPNAVPDTPPLRRLSKTQLQNTLRDVLAELVPDGATLFTNLAPKLALLPDDRQVGPIGDTHGGFRRLDQAVNQEHVDVSYDVAVAIGKALTDPVHLEKLAGSCATDGDASNDDACLANVIKKVASLAQRRPPTDEDVTFYAAIAGADKVGPAALADVVAAILTGPRTLYHVEHGSTDDAWTNLDAWELAARLSYHFWQTMPDAELRDAAASGALLTDAGYQKQVDRLFADARTQAALDDFFREWLWLDELPRLDARLGDVVFDAFRADIKPTPTLNTEMIDDVLASARNVAQSGGTFADLFTDTRAYAKSDVLAKIYGVTPWSTGDAPKAPNRVGLLTRPAFLATGSINSRPIMKGVRIRKALLCDDIPPPPNNAAAGKALVSSTLTTREVVEQLTQQPGTVCSGCHSVVINPLGFATEDFDAFGRHRTSQKLFDDKGNVAADKPIHTDSTPRVKGLDDLRPSAGAGDLTRMLVESGRVQSCFARQYFRFTFSRLENDKDGCAIESVTKGAIEGDSLGAVLKTIALRPEFKRRSF